MHLRALLSLFSVCACVVLTDSATRLSYDVLNRRDHGRHATYGLAYGPEDQQKLDVFMPDGAVAGRPVVVFFYGGSWSSGRRQQFGWVGQALASRGFVVLVADYRQLPQVTYPAFVQDGAAAVRWAQDHAAQYGGDPQRILLMGHSSGAYIAMQLALDDDFLRAAGVDYSRVKGVAGLSGPYDLYASYEREVFGPYYAEGRKTQPIGYAGRPGRPPVLLVHGAADDDVPMDQSVNLDRALRAAGNRSTLHIYPDFDHPGTVYDLSRSFGGDARPVLEEVVRFFNAAAGPAR